MRMRLSFEPNVRPTCRPYRKLVVCELFLNVQTSKQCGKKCQLVEDPWRRFHPPMVQPVQCLIRHCLSAIFLLLFVKMLTFVLLFSYDIAHYEAYLHLLNTRTHGAIHIQVIYHQSADIA